MTMQKRLSSDIVRLTDLIAPVIGRTRWATLNLCCGKTNLLAAIEDGSSFTVQTYDEVLQAYSNRWPAGLEWPEDIARPDPQPLQIASSAAAAE